MTAFNHDAGRSQRRRHLLADAIAQVAQILRRRRVAHVRSHARPGCPGLRDAHISAADHIHAARPLPDGGGEGRRAVRRWRELHIRPDATVGADGQASVGVSRQGQADIAVGGQRVVCLWAERALHDGIALHLGRRKPARGGDDAADHHARCAG